jgi:hypothetical protein
MHLKAVDGQGIKGQNGGILYLLSQNQPTSQLILDTNARPGMRLAEPQEPCYHSTTIESAGRPDPTRHMQAHLNSLRFHT